MMGYLREYNGKCLEVGPGGAPLIEQLTHIGNSQKYALELPELIDYCRKQGFNCISQDAGTERWNLEDDSMDLVVSNQCLEHIPNTDHFISEAHRVLKDGGVLLLSVPNQGALAFIIMMLMTLNPPMNYVSDKFYGLGNPLSSIRWQKRVVPGHNHLRLFTQRAMNDLLKINGFEIIKNHGGSWGVPILGRTLAGIFPCYGLYTTVLSKKVPVPSV